MLALFALVSANVWNVTNTSKSIDLEVADVEYVAEGDVDNATLRRNNKDEVRYDCSIFKQVTFDANGHFFTPDGKCISGLPNQTVMMVITYIAIDCKPGTENCVPICCM